MKTLRFAQLIAFTAAAVVSRAQFVNGDFEDPGLGSGVFTTTGIDGWSSLGVSGVWHPGQGNFSSPVPSGTQIGYVNTGATVAQVSTYNLVEGDNTVSFYLGRRLDGFEGTALIDVWAGGVANGGQIVGGTAIGFKQVEAALLTKGEFQQYTITKNLGNGDPLIGQALGIRFAIIGGTQVDFDRVEIVPEPTTVSVLTLGVLACLRRRQKN